MKQFLTRNLCKNLWLMFFRLFLLSSRFFVLRNYYVIYYVINILKGSTTHLSLTDLSEILSDAISQQAGMIVCSLGHI